MAEDKAAARGVEGQRSLPSVPPMCRAWWIVSPVLILLSYLVPIWLVDSSADINICFNYEWLSYINPPIGSTPMTVQGRGVVKMCVGQYVDHDG